MDCSLPFLFLSNQIDWLLPALRQTFATGVAYCLASE